MGYYATCFALFPISQHVCVFFQEVSGAVVVLLTSLVSFVASTRLIRLEVGAIDTPNQSCQSFEQYGASEVLEKFLERLFDGLSSKHAHFWYFQNFYK